jgi:hypothetical protein
MANWNINCWPWGGVQPCLSEAETKTVLGAEDAVGAVVSAFSAAPPPLDIAAAIIGAFIGLEKGVAELADQGNGICFMLTWVAIAAGVPAGVIPYPNGSATRKSPATWSNPR